MSNTLRGLGLPKSYCEGWFCTLLRIKLNKLIFPWLLLIMMVNSGIMVLSNIQDTTSILIQWYYERALDMRWKIVNRAHSGEIWYLLHMAARPNGLGKISPQLVSMWSINFGCSSNRNRLYSCRISNLGNAKTGWSICFSFDAKVSFACMTVLCSNLRARI